ncbi:MAG: hypothetical protein KAS70_04780 [Planctomycetes bacterium]|nr:hypothetical protein [Planctomycetota bacterium]
MSFILDRDYSVLITDDQLTQITGSQTDLDVCLEQSEEEVKEYLRHRFDVEVDMRSFQISSTGTGVTAILAERIFQSTTNKLYICTAAATSESLTDTNFFAESDDRNQKLVQVVVDVFLYHLHTRLNPRNIPAHRKIRYDGDGDIERAMSATKWLLMTQKGTITPDLTPILDEEGEQPDSGQSIEYGSTPRDGTRSVRTDRFNGLTGN